MSDATGNKFGLALLALGALALIGCGGGTYTDYGPSDPISETLGALAPFTISGDTESPGLAIGDDSSVGAPAMGILVFEDYTLDGIDILEQVVLVARQETPHGTPFAKLGNVVVDILDGSAFGEYRANAITAQEFMDAAPLVPSAGVLSDGPAPGERRLDLSEHDVGDLSRPVWDTPTLVLRLRFDAPAGADGGGDMTSFRATGDASEPRLDVVYRIRGR